MKKLAKLTSGYSHRKLEDLVGKATRKYLKFNAGSVTITMKDCLDQLEVVKGVDKAIAGETRTEKMKKFGKTWGVPIAMTAAALGAGAYQYHKNSQTQERMRVDNLKFQAEQAAFQRKQFELQKEVYENQQSWGTWFRQHGPSAGIAVICAIINNRSGRAPAPAPAPAP